jgi:molybdenum cofactor synthesis domain-containing protein
MSQPPPPSRHVPPRVVVATVGRASKSEECTKIVIDGLETAQFIFVRSVTVTREKQFIQQLVLNVANGNEADAIVLLGGVGLGPRDFTCEAIHELADRRIEGFGEAYRQLLRETLSVGVEALLERATAVVYNKCVVFALPQQPAPLARAVQALVIPTLLQAVRAAEGFPPGAQFGV